MWYTRESSNPLVEERKERQVYNATECPACGITWEGGEIPDGLMEAGGYTREEAEEAARSYGWTPENKAKFGVNHIGIEYPGGHPAHYDGVSEWECTECEARFNRFTGEQLKEGEYAYFSRSHN